MNRKWLGLVLLALLAIGLLVGVPQTLLWLYSSLRHTFGIVVDLLGIFGIAFLVAAFLAPLEALGWWAGWYGDQIEEIDQAGIVERPIQAGTEVSRYIIYLDGIGQATATYLPDVETMLDRIEADTPASMVLLRGIMPYSVLNRSLTDDDRLLSALWKFADSMQVSRYGSLVGTLTSLIINLRNLLLVTVSADGRYGPIYNQGIAQVLYASLRHHGYKLGSAVPITLIGFSGGGQISMGALPFLKRALGTTIEVISISGVISGSVQVLQAEHLFHLVGDNDPLERLGPIVFPKRWRIFFLSYWNRAKRLGKISIHSLGPVGHNGAGGPMDAAATLPDGRTHLQQTVDLVVQILTDVLPSDDLTPCKPSNYDRYQQAEVNQPSHYPLDQPVSENYRPIADWMGRLILPTLAQRAEVRGVWLEVHHAPADRADWVGQTVPLRWSDAPIVQSYIRQVLTDVYFSDEAKRSHRQGIVHPTRLDRWRQVDPLESLAGGRPQDDVIVMLRDVTVADVTAADVTLADQTAADRTLVIGREPIQITGRYYALIRFLEQHGDRVRVVHYNRKSRQFDGTTELVQLPDVVPDRNGLCNSTRRDIQKSSLNQLGWYIYGAVDRSGEFVVQAIAPRALLDLQPDRVIVGRHPAWHYLKTQSWQPSEVPKGSIKSVLLSTKSQDRDIWQEGDRALVVHTYGGIGGRKPEPAARGPIYFGHFAYGEAEIVREPLTDELRFEIVYHQVYTQNADGVIAGALHWSRFLGDRQFGWIGVRPTCDLVIKLEAFTEDYAIYDTQLSALDILVYQLQIMTARYRTGDGTGGTYVAPANNCAQDSNQALYATLRTIERTIAADPDLQFELQRYPEQVVRFGQLVRLAELLRRELLPLGTARADWRSGTENLGLSLEDDPIENLLKGLVSWRSLLPRVASNAIAQQFLKQGASVWVLRSSQVGGNNPDIAPVAPIAF